MLAGPIEMSNKSLLSGSDGHKNNISFANINTFLCKINFWDYSHDSYFQLISGSTSFEHSLFPSMYSFQIHISKSGLFLAFSFMVSDEKPAVCMQSHFHTGK